MKIRLLYLYRLNWCSKHTRIYNRKKHTLRIVRRVWAKARAQQKKLSRNIPLVRRMVADCTTSFNEMKARQIKYRGKWIWTDSKWNWQMVELAERSKNGGPLLLRKDLCRAQRKATTTSMFLFFFSNEKGTVCSGVTRRNFVSNDEVEGMCNHFNWEKTLRVNIQTPSSHFRVTWEKMNEKKCAQWWEHRQYIHRTNQIIKLQRQRMNTEIVNPQYARWRRQRLRQCRRRHRSSMLAAYSSSVISHDLCCIRAQNLHSCCLD